MKSGNQRGGPNNRRGSRGGFKSIGSRGRDRGAVYTDKVTKIKQKLIHNAKVKKEFYRTLKNEGVLETPDHLKSIFEEGGAEVEDSDISKYEKTRSDSEEETKSDDAQSTSKEKKTQGKPKSSSKPNPYKRAMADVERQEQERLAVIEAERKEREDALKKRQAYYRQRNNLKKKYTEKTSRGQPVMRGQINHLLDKIKKMN
ncbi:hypothetical protein K7432_004814 [Basidiobolus ranarum]|uniref:rRNA-processing protein FYV7 n=1 Tax=Basidiobolus ranarum TaxID=34480 RepID=A0ABR2WXP1_9FUNG